MSDKPWNDDLGDQKDDEVIEEVVIVKCSRCGRVLTSSLSIKREMGDDCAAKTKKEANKTL